MQEPSTAQEQMDDSTGMQEPEDQMSDDSMSGMDM
jgi:hypothetical protein